MTQRSTIQAGKPETGHKTGIFIVYLRLMDENTHIDANTGETEIENLHQEAQGRSDIAHCQQGGGALNTPGGEL
jgi:hypothetical protein